MSDETEIDFGHGDKGLSPLELELMTKGTVTVKGVTYTTKTVDIQERFTDPSLQPSYNVCVIVEGHPCMENGSYLATGTLRQCYEYILSL